MFLKRHMLLGKRGRTVSLKVENIKKLMGWCPNAKAHEARRSVYLENFDSNVPDRTSGDIRDLKDPGWLLKESTQVLLFDIFLTFVYILLYNQIGFLPFTLLCGLSTGLAYVAVYWNQRIQRYDAIAKKPDVRYVSKKSFWISLAIILPILFSLVFLPYIPIIGTHIMQVMFSLLANFLSLMWGAYFQIIYWERKNHMKIYRKYENSFQKTYAIGGKEGKL